MKKRAGGMMNVIIVVRNIGSDRTSTKVCQSFINFITFHGRNSASVDLPRPQTREEQWLRLSANSCKSSGSGELTIRKSIVCEEMCPISSRCLFIFFFFTFVHRL